MNEKCLVVKASGGGGLGDLIKSLLVAVTYASLSKRILFVDWSGSVYTESEENIFSRFFKLTNIKTLEQLPDSDDVFPLAWKGRIEQSLDQVYHDDGWQAWDRKKVIETYSFDLGSIDYENDVLVMWEFDQAKKLFPFLQNIKSELDLYQYAYKKFIRFSNEFQSKLNVHLASLTHPLLGLHVRSTNEFNINKNSSLVVADYFRESNKIMSLHSPATIFLATDNSEVRSAFDERYDDIYSIDKWFAKPGEPLHLNDYCPDEMVNLQNALMDIVLLSRSDYLVITPNSSFSEIAVIFSSRLDHNMTIIKPYRKTLKTKLKSYLKLFKN